MPHRLSFSAITVLLTLSSIAAADQSTPPSRQHFVELLRLAQPQAGEALWAGVPWLTDLSQARRRAVAEDKPLFIWRSGGGDVLGRT